LSFLLYDLFDRIAVGRVELRAARFHWCVTFMPIPTTPNVFPL